MTLINCSERYVAVGNVVADFSEKIHKVPLRIASLLVHIDFPHSCSYCPKYSFRTVQNLGSKVS